MYLAQLLRANPLMALSFSYASQLFCGASFARRQRNGLDKMLTGLLGFIAIYEALRILKDSGFSAFSRFRTWKVGGPHQRLPVSGGGTDPENIQRRSLRHQAFICAWWRPTKSARTAPMR